MPKNLKNIKNLPLIAALILSALILCFLSETDRRSEYVEEARLANILSLIEGAGEVTVYIPKSEETQSAYAYNAQQDETGQKGSIIIASGADDPMVRIKLISAAAAALGISEEDVRIYKGDG